MYTPPRKSPIGRPGGGRRGIQHIWVACLCLVSFGMGYTFGAASEYDKPVPMGAGQLQAPLAPTTKSRSKNSGGGAIFDIAQELIENTLGVEMLGQAETMETEKLKTAFYKALASAFGGSKAMSIAASAGNNNNNNNSNGASQQVAVVPEQDFLGIATSIGTYKVQAHRLLPKCTKDDSKNGCAKKGCKNVRCIPYGHYYDTLYQSQLGHLSKSDAEAFQALEIGFYRGSGYETFERWLPNAELHSLEISCLPPGPMKEGKWPYENTAIKNKELYDKTVAKGLMHCGDAGNIPWVDNVWKTTMKRHDAPPLKLVVEDASHLSVNMAKSLFYWFPRIAPGGYLVFEGIQPVDLSNRFRTQVLPQIMVDLHYCGEPKFPDEGPCFPTIQPLLASVYCELHICVFKRNDEPAQELSLELSQMPPNALDASKCPSLQKQAWER